MILRSSLNSKVSSFTLKLLGRKLCRILLGKIGAPTKEKKVKEEKKKEKKEEKPKPKKEEEPVELDAAE